MANIPSPPSVALVPYERPQRVPAHLRPGGWDDLHWVPRLLAPDLATAAAARVERDGPVIAVHSAEHPDPAAVAAALGACCWVTDADVDGLLSPLVADLPDLAHMVVQGVAEATAASPGRSLDDWIAAPGLAETLQVITQAHINRSLPFGLTCLHELSPDGLRSALELTLPLGRHAAAVVASAPSVRQLSALVSALEDGDVASAELIADPQAAHAWVALTRTL